MQNMAYVKNEEEVVQRARKMHEQYERPERDRIILAAKMHPGLNKGIDDPVMKLKCAFAASLCFSSSRETGTRRMRYLFAHVTLLSLLRCLCCGVYVLVVT
jgi:hypothetical protein